MVSWREREREHVVDYVVSRILCNNVYERVGYYLYEIQSIFYLRMPSFERKSSCNVRVTRYTVHAPYSITINSAKISKVNESYLFPSRIKKTNVNAKERRRERDPIEVRKPRRLNWLRSADVPANSMDRLVNAVVRGNSAAVVPLLLRSSIARPACQRPLYTAALPRDIPSPFSYDRRRIDHGTANVQPASVNHVDGQPSKRLVIIQAW